MRKFMCLASVLFLVVSKGTAQKEINYINPPTIFGNGYSLQVDDIVSNESVCKLRMAIKNSSPDSYLVYYYQKSGFAFDKMGKYYERKEKGEVISPNGKEAFVVKVTGNDYRHPSFTFHPEGLFSASINVPAIEIGQVQLKPGKTEQFEMNGVSVKLNEVSEKKGTINVTLEIGLIGKEGNSLLIIDPSKLNLVTEEGTAVESDIKNDKARALLAGESKKVKFSYISSKPVFLNWNNALKVSTLVPVTVEPIQIVDKVIVKPAPQAVNTRPKSECSPFMSNDYASVKVKIQGEDGVCFKLDINGFPVVTEFASAAMIYVNPGRQKMVFTLADGSVIDETSLINDWYSEVGYNVVQKKNGEYAVRYDMMAQVLSSTGQQQRNDMMARTQKPTAPASSTTSSEMPTNSSGISGQSGCFGPETQGATSVKLRFTWKGSPVANHSIKISLNGSVVGIGKTDQSGVAKLYTNSLQSRQIDIDGCSGNYTWRVTGSYCVLDSSNSLDMDLYEMAKMVGSLMGKTADEIGSGWGF